MSVFSKINVARPHRNKSVHNLSRDVNTTSAIGFIQPTNLVEVIPGDTITIETESFARLMPLVVPTFGRLMCKTYHRFIPITDVDKAFESMLAGVEVNTISSGTYIPKEVVQDSIQNLTLRVLQYADVTVYLHNKSTHNVTISDFRKDDLFDELTPNAHLFTSEYIRMCTSTDSTSSLYRVGFDEADFVIQLGEGSASESVACFRLSTIGKNLRKVLIGLGYQLDPGNHQHVSILPLLAYYKAYFDTFVVERNINWTSTPAYKLIDSFFESDLRYIPNLVDGFVGLLDTYQKFFSDLAHCYYVDDPDYFTAGIPSPAVNESGHTPAVNNIASLGVNTSAQSSQNAQPDVDSVANFGIASLKVAQVLYNRVNAQSVFGSNVRKYLESVYGADALTSNEAYKVGESQYLINISDVMNMAESSDALLGEFAGRGLGSGKSETFTFNNNSQKTYGYLISFCTVVPISGYVQGVDRVLMHADRYDFADPGLDAIGFQLTLKGEYIGSNDVVTHSQLAGTFQKEAQAFLPRYSEYKTQPHNILNGDLSRRGSRASMLPYTLDRWFTPQGLTYRLTQSTGVASHLQFTPGYQPTVVNPYMRSIGLSGALGNFNRIFANPGTSDESAELDDISVHGEDQFILHNIYNVKRVSYLKSIRDSFETGGNEMAVEHQ